MYKEINPFSPAPKITRGATGDNLREKTDQKSAERGLPDHQKSAAAYSSRVAYAWGGGGGGLNIL